MDQNTTSVIRQNDCNKFRVKSQNYIEKHKIAVQPQNLVIPVPDKVETHQVKVDTHSSSDSEVQHSKRPKKAESDPRIANYDQHNQSQWLPKNKDHNTKWDNFLIFYSQLLQPTKKDN